MRFVGRAGAVLLLALAVGCSRGPGGSGPVDPVQPPDSGTGSHDPGTDGGTSTDGGTGTDGGTDGGSDGGTDGGTADGGTDGGTAQDCPTDKNTGRTYDCSGKITFGTPGPWPVANDQFGAAQGILETPVVGMSTDEAQNLWVATRQALYLLKPGQTVFQRFDGKDGLHVQSNRIPYKDSWDNGNVTYGGAVNPGIAEITGGGPNEVFVGYWGNDEGTQMQDDPNRHTGKLDRVRIMKDGGIQVDFIDLVGSDDWHYWHNRTIQRLLYDHQMHPHELFVGTNHGVTRIYPDKFRVPNKGEWFNSVNHEFMSDHLHPRACYHAPCPPPPDDSNQKMGEWRGLALSHDGNLWVGGRWSAGKIRWTDKIFVENCSDANGIPCGWAQRPGGYAFVVAMGDPYPGNRPVFEPPQEGDAVSISAVTEDPDGASWWASGPWYNGPMDIAYGIASTPDGYHYKYYDPVNDAGLPEKNVRDLVALPDGRLVVAGPTTGLVFWNPKTGEKKSLRAGQGIPDDRILRLELDTMVNPPVLHVSTWGGAARIRVLP